MSKHPLHHTFQNDTIGIELAIPISCASSPDSTDNQGSEAAIVGNESPDTVSDQPAEINRTNLVMSSGSTEHISRDDDADKWVIPSDKETLRVVLNQEGDDGTIITKVEGLEVEYGDAYPQVPGGVDVNQHDVLPFDDLDGFSDPVEGPLLGIKAAEMRPEAPFPENEVSYDESLPPSSPPCSSPAPSLTSSPCNEPGTVHKRDIESVKSKKRTSLPQQSQPHVDPETLNPDVKPLVHDVHNEPNGMASSSTFESGKNTGYDCKASCEVDVARPQHMHQFTSLPNPKRPTLASQRSEYKKLAKPFRPPTRMVFHPTEKKADIAVPSKEKDAGVLKSENGSSKQYNVKSKAWTERAAGQFKSPLSTTAKVFSDVKFTPTIQALERKLQILKRAVHIRQKGNDVELQGLIRKWTEAGREVAWEMWNLVKDRTNGDQQLHNTIKRSYQDNWGWSEQGDPKKACAETSWDWNASSTEDITDENNRTGQKSAESDSVDQYEYEKGENTLGTMLAQLGIDRWILGWNEEEGGFDTEIVD